jgi:hypothetical protein
MLILSILDLKTHQIDYAQAFPQAKLDDPVFLKIPQGWYISNRTLHQHEDNDTTHYLWLKCSLHGIKQAAHDWFKYLCTGLQDLGFTQSSTDCCLFLTKDFIIIVYVDNCLIFAPKMTTIDQLISDLSSKYMLQNEGDFSLYLRVQDTKDPKPKTITLTQTVLIKQVIKEVGLNEFRKGKEMPADGILLIFQQPSCHETWNYQSVIRKLNYLANNTWPDISMAVHQ